MVSGCEAWEIGHSNGASVDGSEDLPTALAQ